MERDQPDISPATNEKQSHTPSQRNQKAKSGSEWWRQSTQQKQALQQLLNDFNLGDLLHETARKLGEAHAMATERIRWRYPLDTFLEALVEYSTSVRVDFYAASDRLHISLPIRDVSCYIATDSLDDGAENTKMTYFARINLPEGNSMVEMSPSAVVHTSVRARTIRAKVEELNGEWPEIWSIMNQKKAIR